MVDLPLISRLNALGIEERANQAGRGRLKSVVAFEAEEYSLRWR